jgi:hypothetical protein
MSRRVIASFAAVSAVLVMTSAVLAAPVPKVPAGSKVFIAPMDGFDRYFRAAKATSGGELPLVFVATRAEAEYEISGITSEVTPTLEENVRDRRTTRQDTTVSMTRIASGETVFTHSVTTLVRSPGKSAHSVEAGGHGQTPSRLLDAGKQTAARQCVKAMQATFTEK